MYIQHCMDLQLAVDPYKRSVLFESMDWLPKNTQSHLTYFCKLNINQLFTNGSGMIWGVRISIFTEIRHLVEELITFLSIFGPQKLGISTARLNKSLSISTSIQWEGISVLKHAQNLHSCLENNSFWKTLWWACGRWCTPSKVSWIGIIQGFFSGGATGSPHLAKILPIPPSDTCPRFWTKGCPPPQPRFVPENLKNLNTFLCQIWLLLSSKVQLYLKNLYFRLKIAKKWPNFALSGQFWL